MSRKRASETTCDFIRLITIQIDTINKKKEKGPECLEEIEELEKLKKECQLFFTEYYIVK